MTLEIALGIVANARAKDQKLALLWAAMVVTLVQHGLSIAETGPQCQVVDI